MIQIKSRYEKQSPTLKVVRSNRIGRTNENTGTSKGSGVILCLLALSIFSTLCIFDPILRFKMRFRICNKKSPRRSGDVFDYSGG